MKRTVVTCDTCGAGTQWPWTTIRLRRGIPTLVWTMIQLCLRKIRIFDTTSVTVGDTLLDLCPMCTENLFMRLRQRPLMADLQEAREEAEWVVTDRQAIPIVPPHEYTTGVGQIAGRQHRLVEDGARLPRRNLTTTRAMGILTGITEE